MKGSHHFTMSKAFSCTELLIMIQERQGLSQLEAYNYSHSDMI